MKTQIILLCCFGVMFLLAITASTLLVHGFFGPSDPPPGYAIVQNGRYYSYKRPSGYIARVYPQWTTRRAANHAAWKMKRFGDERAEEDRLNKDAWVVVP